VYASPVVLVFRRPWHVGKQRLKSQWFVTRG
jgi:hypothetical protein